MEKLYCGECGHVNPLENKFCNKCGARINYIPVAEQNFIVKPELNEPIEGAAIESDVLNTTQIEKTDLPKKTGDSSKVIIFIIAIFVLIGIYEYYANNHGVSSTAESPQTTESSQPNKTEVGVGEILKTDFFEITVNKVTITDYVNTGNEFTDLKKHEGSSYLVMNVTFKNIDNESRMITDGELLVNYNGSDYKFDKSETIMLDGWGLFLDQINPLTSKTTKLVYKIPSELKGKIYWHPGRAASDEQILLGDIQ